VKVLHLCFSDSRGGGFIGAYRLHRAMLSQGVESRMLVVHKHTDDPTVMSVGMPKQLLNRVYRTASAAILKAQVSRNGGVRSLNIFPTGIHRYINKSDADIVQLHWINKNTISIGEIAKIKKPLFWKLPDMWAFSGTEHYLNPGDHERYKEGYHSENRQHGDRGIDLDKALWQYKQRCWSDADFSVVCPSQWLANCAKESKLFEDRNIYNIPNPIDLDVYQPMSSKASAKQRFGLLKEKKSILFGSLKAMGDRRKGFQHLEKAIAILSKTEGANRFELAILGETGPAESTLHNIPVKYLGTTHDDNILVKAYSAADVMVLPAELDNLPNTIQEAMACGTPCVGFRVGGLPDMISHKKSGYLAEPFDEADLARGIEWVLNQPSSTLSDVVRASAKSTHDPAARVSQYLGIYKEKLESNRYS
jgi:glycosyltransferase involved in cell wall biosynthesis